MRPDGLGEPASETETGRSQSAPFLVTAGPETSAVTALAPAARLAAATTAASATAATAAALLAGLAPALAAAALLPGSTALVAGTAGLLSILWHLFLRMSGNPAFS